MVSLHAASDTDHLRAGEPGGAGNPSEQTGGEPGDRDGPQVSLTKQLSQGLKGTVHPKYTYFLLPIVLFIHLCFGASCQVFEILNAFS